MGYISSIQFPLPGNWREKKKKNNIILPLQKEQALRGKRREEFMFSLNK